MRVRRENNQDGTGEKIISCRHNVKIREVQARSVLTKSKLPESDYCINPYIGCAHGCAYCYARFLGRWRGHTEKWGSYVDVRVNAPEVLARELKRRRDKGIILLGSMTDAYQPLERKYRLSRRILSLLVGHDFTVSILTKSDLVLRDIDILLSLQNCEVGLTVTFHNDTIRTRLEPFSSPIPRRLQALRILHEAGIRTYAFVGPIFPELTDFERILEQVAEHVDYVMGETLNLQCGNWKDLEPILQRLCPDLKPKYRIIMRSSDYWDEVHHQFAKACSRLGIRLVGFYRHERKQRSKT